MMNLRCNSGGLYNWASRVKGKVGIHMVTILTIIAVHRLHLLDRSYEENPGISNTKLDQGYE